ncbi:hypothetical protein L1887_50207 [Cichorium endivia]|nr:hypothetical protein L1887_50207 [Cichorium endivia]
MLDTMSSYDTRLRGHARQLAFRYAPFFNSFDSAATQTRHSDIADPSVVWADSELIWMRCRAAKRLPDRREHACRCGHLCLDAPVRCPKRACSGPVGPTDIAPRLGCEIPKLRPTPPVLAFAGFGSHFGTQPRACVWNASNVCDEFRHRAAAALSLCRPVLALLLLRCCCFGKRRRWAIFPNSKARLSLGVLPGTSLQPTIWGRKKGPKVEAQVEGEGEITPCCAAGCSC